MTRSLVRALVLAAVAASPASAAASEFYGIHAWTTPGEADFTTMARGGAGTFRFTLTWNEVEPEPGERSWSRYDEIFLQAAAAGLRPLPVIVGSPAFAAARPEYPPTRSAAGREAFAAFVSDAVDRYGPGGALWQANGGIAAKPVRAWQVWNEPNFPAYWFGRPNAAEYAELLRVAGGALRSRDPGAQVVLAGIPETKFPGAVRMTRFITQLYRVPGAKNLFDVVAVHPYAADERGVIGAVRRTRKIMRRSGDARKKVWLTEVGWATGGKVSGNTRRFKVSRRVQAIRLTRTFRAARRLRASARLGLIVWFSWRDRPPMSGEPNWWAIHTGLFDRRGRPKPAWRAFRRVAR